MSAENVNIRTFFGPIMLIFIDNFEIGEYILEVSPNNVFQVQLQYIIDDECFRSICICSDTRIYTNICVNLILRCNLVLKLVELINYHR